MLPSDEVAIETPEQIDLMLEPAGLGSRFVAWVVDLLTKGLLLFVLFVVAVVFAALLGKEVAQWFAGYYLALLLLVVALLVMGYDVYFEVRHNGQTPGKRHQGLRVMREGGGPVDFRSACLRSLLFPVDFLPLFYVLGGTLVLLTRHRQRLGDLAAGTIVIRERTAAPVVTDDLVADLASEDFVFTPEHLAACTPGDRQVLRSFFQRYRDMDEEARYQLAGRLTDLFLGRTGFRAAGPVDPGADAERFLASLHRDLESWVRQGR
jgi:uncharacterized RDD family membrane protein YckC